MQRFAKAGQQVVLAYAQCAEHKVRDVVFTIKAHTLSIMYRMLRTHKRNPAQDAEDNLLMSVRGQASERNCVTDVHQSIYLFLLP